MKKNKVTGLVGTIVLHVVLLLLLLLVAISKPKVQEEGGVPVMLGNMEMAQGNADPYTLTDVDILDEPQLPSEVSAPEPVPTPPVKTEMITQEDEPTIAVPKKETPKPTVKKETIKKETPKKEPVKPEETKPSKPVEQQKPNIQEEIPEEEIWEDNPSDEEINTANNIANTRTTGIRILYSFIKNVFAPTRIAFAISTILGVPSGSSLTFL